MLAKDPYILLSIVNTKLRDRYASLEELCEDLDEVQSDIEASLNSIGYSYNRNLNSFTAN